MIFWILMKLRSIIDRQNITKILMKKIKINSSIKDMIGQKKDQIIKNLEYKTFLISNKITRIYYWAQRLMETKIYFLQYLHQD
jgi:hypothetical protein